MVTQLTAAEASRINKLNYWFRKYGVGSRIRALEGGELASGSVDTAEIAANAVTYAKLDAAGRKYKIRTHRAATDTAATDFELPLGSIDFAGTITAVHVVGDTGFGQASNYSSLAIVNRGGAGSGSTSAASMDYNSSNTVTAWVPKDMTLSGTPANLNVASGDVLTLKKTHTGSGQALPTNLTVEIVIERTA